MARVRKAAFKAIFICQTNLEITLKYQGKDMDSSLNDHAICKILEEFVRQSVNSMSTCDGVMEQLQDPAKDYPLAAPAVNI